MANENEKRKAGAPKKYEDRVTIMHSIENDVLKQLDDLAEYGSTRTDIVNKAIIEYLERNK